MLEGPGIQRVWRFHDSVLLGNGVPKKGGRNCVAIMGDTKPLCRFYSVFCCSNFVYGIGSYRYRLVSYKVFSSGNTFPSLVRYSKTCCVCQYVFFIRLFAALY